MELSPKATKFIIEALDYRIKAYRDSLDDRDLDEDEISDITNDAMFLEELRKELVKTLNNNGKAKISYPSETASI
ncbi:hypothetical protein H6S82_03690 [Planktothrix sp. FACHB-1355]|uniref:Uncharacterized protein n=1 Tax=Aerosakkonema funiforme FACHB-1375 TaxID=2949571 RepID=A0A926VB28_9CYAN|nr:MULTISPECIES: hypothetical protein [Oscillatoriales]MBD2179652.1 hypothetical protein [Aerosakkonema funiforme FACHB-1375]MBD3557959.1 hypothetical protein [Planktothrix sp. FACHB-1355]